MVWHAVLLCTLMSHGISVQIFGLVSCFLFNREIQGILDRKCSQKHPVHARVPQGSIPGPILSLSYINYPLDDVTCNIFACNMLLSMLMILLYFKCDQAFDQWQHLEYMVLEFHTVHAF